MFPPHLPPPASSIAAHHRLERLKIIAVSSLIGAVAGFSGAAMLLGWVWPHLEDEAGFWGGINRYQTGTHVLEIDPRLREEMKSRLAVVYSEALPANGTGYLKESARVGEAVLVSSGGWMVLYRPGFNGVITGWTVLLPSGATRVVAAARFDPRSGLLYLKVSNPPEIAGKAPDQFAVAAFAESVVVGETVFAYTKNTWTPVTVFSPHASRFAGAHLDSAVVETYPLSRPLVLGSVAINASGRIAGIVTSEGTLFPAPGISRFLSGILENGEIVYWSLGAEGWFDEEQPVIDEHVRQAGFYVYKVVNTTSPLRRGDVILSINGQMVNFQNMWYTVGTPAKDLVRLEIIRGGQEITIALPRVRLPAPK